ncbi:MAG: hypothetical protein PHQ43_12360 [Dehalococcoidales bacterium]|nr:hypothetical protein [Dehalococcoidales bacterium]
MKRFPMLIAVAVLVLVFALLIPAVAGAEGDEKGQFIFDVPEEIYANDATVIPMTYKHFCGKLERSNVRFFFWVDEGPTESEVTFAATDSEGIEYTFINEGAWGPEGGFPVDEGYEATTDWTITFSHPGDYTICFELHNLNYPSDPVIVSEKVVVQVSQEEPEPEKPKHKSMNYCPPNYPAFMWSEVFYEMMERYGFFGAVERWQATYGR